MSRDLVNWPEKAFDFRDYDPCDGDLPDMPFGEEIANPWSRTIPANFCRKWQDERNGQCVELAIDELFLFNRKMPVIAVRMMGAEKIAVVAQVPEDGRWLYGLWYFGLEDEGQRLRDLEGHTVWKAVSAT